jgi:hypothetical protein
VEQPIWIGHTFRDWRSSDSIDYTPGESLVMPDHGITFFVCSTVNKYKLIYYGNVSTVGECPEEKLFPYNTTVAIAAKGALEKSSKCISFLKVFTDFFYIYKNNDY